MLTMLVSALGGNPYFHRFKLLPQAAEAVATAEAERGRLCPDRGRGPPDGPHLEDLRMLLSTEMDSRSAAAMLLIGQPTLRRRLRQTVYAALEQRIALRVHLDGMDLEETSAYIRHHLNLAGRKDTLFSDDAVAVVQQASKGLPRAVNNLAIQALVATFAANKNIVDEAAAKMAVVEVAGE